MVQTLYRSFREFVDSDSYDPISYEKLPYGEVFDLVLIDGRENLVREITARDGADSYALIQTIMDFAYEYERGYPRRSDLAEFIRMSTTYWDDSSIAPDDVDEQIGDLLGKEWNDWTVDQRIRFVEEELFLFTGCGGFGENLRELRSPLIESWLTSHA